ncbi:hypothetical protein BH23ACT3_BH23ACT3_16570 [soil metagenome]
MTTSRSGPGGEGIRGNAGGEGQNVAMNPRNVVPTHVVGALLVMVLVTVAAACSESTSSPTTAVTIELPATTTSTTTTTTPPTTTSAPTTTTTTTSTTSTTSTTEVTTTTETVTTEPPVVRELVLRPGGIGAASFGADPDGVIDYLRSFLGSPTSDSGWTEPDEFALCPGTEVRRVEWGVLRIGFGDVSTFATDRRHVYSWQYGLDGQIGGEPQGLRTENGPGLGSTVADLVAASPDVALYEGDEELFPPGFELDDGFFGFLTGLADDDVVTEMFGGYFCGE